MNGTAVARIGQQIEQMKVVDGADEELTTPDQLEAKAGADWAVV